MQRERGTSMNLILLRAQLRGLSAFRSLLDTPC